MAASAWPFVISLTHITHPCPPFPCLARHAEVGYVATSAFQIQSESIQVGDGNDGNPEVLRV